MHTFKDIHVNHADYQRKVKALTDEELRFTIKDCREAMAAYPENPKCNYYADEIHYCHKELRNRAKGH